MPYTFTTEPLESYEDIDRAQLTRDASTLLESIESSWTKNKVLDFNTSKYSKVDVTTYSNTIDNNFWVARSTNFANSSNKKEIFDKLTRYDAGSTTDLNLTHSFFEKYYVPSVHDAQLKLAGNENAEDDTSITYLAKMYYKFQFPIKNRLFYAITYVKKSANSYIVIQLPISPSFFNDLSSPPDHVIGNYVSIERATYDETRDKLNWIMATIPNPGGSIPNFVIKLSIHAEIVKDVPHFLEWDSETAKRDDKD